MARLLLFDIDGTLVDSNGQSKPLFASALTEVFGTIGPIDGYDFSGKTDPRIVFDLMTGAGLDAALVRERTPRVRDLYLDALDRHLDRDRMRLLPGVEPLLAELAARPDVVVALLTGNWERGARIKLGRFGLFERFRFGSFGDDQLDRDALPPVALARAGELLGRRVGPEEALIIGDSLLDIACARANGIRCLAVATGRTSAAALAAAGADRLARDLEDRAAFGDLLGEAIGR
ncbi:MAG: HAD hydrolase-like protein [Thermoanaerobaculia bacterium]